MFTQNYEPKKMDVLKALAKQPWWIIALVLGAVFVALPCVTVDKDYRWTTHPPNTYLLAATGIALLLLSSAAFAFTIITTSERSANDAGGLDLRRVSGSKGEFWTTVSGCEIRVVSGRIEDYEAPPGSAIVLPCNEYFDDLCVNDIRSALGAYASRAFEGRVDDFVALIKDECSKKLGPGSEKQKTEKERAASFGIGRCLLLLKPLGRSAPIALVSTSTQAAGQGLSSRITYLFEAVRNLASCLADERLNSVVMPLLGAGHGQLDPPLTLVALILAVAEAARYGQGSQRLKNVTIVVFRKNEETPAEVDETVVRRTLALVGSPAKL
ncbi:MAG TPA: macro domain-containing protein [Candidatus Sulfotelmatobacter sp.]